MDNDEGTDRREADDAATKLGELHLDLRNAPPTPAPNNAEAHPPPPVVTVAELLPTPPFSPTAGDKPFDLNSKSTNTHDAHKEQEQPETPSPTPNPRPPPIEHNPEPTPTPTQQTTGKQQQQQQEAEREQQPLTTFHLFPYLPPELRLKIWHSSFQPRTIELHTRRTHYADDDYLPHHNHNHHSNHHHNQYPIKIPPPKWQSNSRNPAALAVSGESRFAALEFYTVALPLHTHRHGNSAGGRWQLGELLRDGDRKLYLNPEVDTVVLLGDLHYPRLTKLLEWVRMQEEAYYFRRHGGAGGGCGCCSRSHSPPLQDQEHGGETGTGTGTEGGDYGYGRGERRGEEGRGKEKTRGKGLRRLAMAAAPWTHAAAALTLKAFARTLFADVEEFVLFMYAEPVPPDTWRGGRCVLEEACEEEDAYRRFVIGRGKQFREGDEWMVVGKRPIKVVDIRFLDEW